MNKYLGIVIAGFIAGIMVVYGGLAYLRAQSESGKDCNPNYSGCVSEYSCSDLGESVKVIGEDVYGLDRDGDGTGCDWNGGTWESKTIFRSFLFGGVGGAIATWLAVRGRYEKDIEAKKQADIAERTKAQRERAQNEGMICPKCNQVLLRRSGKYGKFVGCSAYPSCAYTRKA